MTPINTKILDLIEARLKNISVANGYFNDLIRIERAQLKPFKNQDMPAINYYTTSDEAADKVYQAVSERTVNVMIEFYSTTRDRIFTDLANELSQDVIIALDRDTTDPTIAGQLSPSLGGTVMRLTIPTINPVIGEGQKPYCGAIMIVAVTYKVNRSDPFTIIN